ncbi:helix-turn-helix transcriptional regulator [Ammoniphilus sp. CFH 90114]|uniref:helix-turn-helix domain-containing protein n=1 Tax=Ammoniphilus sp. CFH 90114 TaxID=2493665 RepID=UPI0013E97615|nr:helix-turn-helix transcriptional regulator [Ammoniphilus sp. CFH 90114]
MKKRSLLGDYLRKLRIEAGYEQMDIHADGVITQSRISRIESGKALPSTDDLRYLSYKYGFTLFHIEKVLNEPNQNLDPYQFETKEHIRAEIEAALLKDEFKKLDDFYRQAISIRLFTHSYEEAFLERVQGILQMELYGDYEQAYHHLNNARKTSEQIRQKEKMAEALNSIGILYIHQHQFEKAKNALLEAQQAIKTLPQNYSHQVQQIHTRILYNLSIVFYHLENFRESIQYSYQSKHLSQNSMGSLLIGEATYQNGLSHYYTGNQEVAQTQFNQAIMLFEVYEKPLYKTHTQKKLIDLKLKKPNLP